MYFPARLVFLLLNQNIIPMLETKKCVLNFTNKTTTNHQYFTVEEKAILDINDCFILIYAEKIYRKNLIRTNFQT